MIIIIIYIISRARLMQCDTYHHIVINTYHHRLKENPPPPPLVHHPPAKEIRRNLKKKVGSSESESENAKLALLLDLCWKEPRRRSWWRTQGGSWHSSWRSSSSTRCRPKDSKSWAKLKFHSPARWRPSWMWWGRSSFYWLGRRSPTSPSCICWRNRVETETETETETG